MGKELSGNRYNLQRLIFLRFIVTLGEIGAVAYAISELRIVLPLALITIILGSVVLLSILTLFRLRLPAPVSRFELFVQLNIDVVVLTALLYYTGGSTNPFAPLYLLPLTLTAASLPGLYAWAMVLVTTCCYSMLFYFYVPLPDMHGSHAYGFRIHVLGMWLGFILSAVLIAGFISRMARTVRSRDRKISTMREQQLRQERILALGTLAAGAAHELGTPLTTMAILLKDQQPDHPISTITLDTLNQQLDRCKSILGTISAASGEVRAVAGSSSRLDEHMHQLTDNWLKTRTDVRANVIFNGAQPAPSIVTDQTLDQALVNIFNNAADASPQDVTITGEWSNDVLILEVADRGEGLSPNIADLAGELIHSTKQDGLGLGLFLTYATLERLGGKVQLYNREGGGVLCQVRLPLANIQIPDGHD